MDAGETSGPMQAAGTGLVPHMPQNTTPQQTSDLHIAGTEPLVSPAQLAAEQPATEAHIASVSRGRSQVEAVLRQEDPRLMVIVGPCSIHDERAALEYAEKLARLEEQVREQVLVVMRVYFEKPRTTVGWKGLVYDPNLDGTFDINEGLRRARWFKQARTRLCKFPIGTHAGRQSARRRG